MEYYRGDSLIFNFKLNRILFGSKSEGKLSPRSCSIQFEEKMKIYFAEGSGNVSI